MAKITNEITGEELISGALSIECFRPDNVYSINITDSNTKYKITLTNNERIRLSNYLRTRRLVRTKSGRIDMV